MSLENVEIVRRSLDGWNRGDMDAWLEGAHPDIEWYSEIAGRMQGVETVSRGRAAMRQYWEEWHAIWNVTVDVADIRDLGDAVIALGRFRTRGGASGIDLERAVGYVYEFDQGLARTVRSYLDPRQALEAAGLTE